MDRLTVGMNVIKTHYIQIINQLIKIMKNQPESSQIQENDK